MKSAVLLCAASVSPAESLQLSRVRNMLSTDGNHRSCDGLRMTHFPVWENVLQRQGRCIGAGDFGSAFLVDSTCDGEVVQKDIIPRDRRNLLEYYSAKSEVLMQLGSSSPFSIRVYDFWPRETDDWKKVGRLSMLMEPALGGDLDKYVLGASKDLNRRVPLLTKFFLDVAKGLRAAHKAGFVHRDIKGSNVFVSVPSADFDCYQDHAKCTAKLGDYGLACTFVDWPLPKCTDSASGTPQFASPEATVKGGSTPAHDWWSLGILIMQVWSEAVHDYSALAKLLPRNPTFPQMKEAFSAYIRSLRTGWQKSTAMGKAFAEQQGFNVGGVKELMEAAQGMTQVSVKERWGADEIIRKLEQAYSKSHGLLSRHEASDGMPVPECVKQCMINNCSKCDANGRCM